MKKNNIYNEKNPSTNSVTDKCTILVGSGNLTFYGNISINGRFQGNLIVNGILKIEANAVVSGGIIADILILSGSYSGDAFVEKKCVFHSGSFFSGHLISNNVELEDGCVFKGRRSAPKSSKSDILRPGKGKEILDDDNGQASLKNLFNS